MTSLFQKTKLASVAALLVLAVGQQASASTITFGGQVATDGSGITSVKVPANNLITAPTDIFIETFDAATAVQGFPSANNTTYTVDPLGRDAGCQVNSPLAITTSTAANVPRVLGVRKGSTTNVAAAPAGDSTCYGYTTPEAQNVNSWVDIDYTAFLAGLGGDREIGYLGFYWGSVDTYNTFQFYSGDNLVSEITGPTLLALFNGQSGDQQSERSNKYVNIDFSPAEAFDRLRILSSGIAGEFDNVVIQLSPVPAPTSLALLGLGLLGLGLGRRYKK